MHDLFALPEYAIQTFERLTQLSVTVHDLRGILWPYIAPERFHHHTPWCTAVKVSGFNECCHDFEVIRLTPVISALPGGRIQRCHAGFVEWAVPLFEDGTLACVLFAGQRVCSTDIPNMVIDEQLSNIDSSQMAQPPTIDPTLAECYRESLCQLVARLTAWRSSVKAILKQAPVSVGEGEIDRIVLIRRFISGRHTTAVSIDDLAAELHVSTSRAAHLVRELFGQTFHTLLIEARLRTAASLLRHTSLGIADVAYTSGFSDLSHFYRIFKHRMHMTPHRYRSYSSNIPTAETYEGQLE